MHFDFPLAFPFKLPKKGTKSQDDANSSISGVHRRKSYLGLSFLELVPPVWLVKKETNSKNKIISLGVPEKKACPYLTLATVLAYSNKNTRWTVAKSI